MCVCVCVCVCVRSLAQLCWSLCDPTDWSSPGSSVHGVFQARILEWVVIFSSRGVSQPRDQNCNSCVFCIGRQILYPSATWKAYVALKQLKKPFLPMYNFITLQHETVCFLVYFLKILSLIKDRKLRCFTSKYFYSCKLAVNLKH